MALFAKQKKYVGSMAICLQADGVAAASVRRPNGGLPSVELIGFVPATDTSAITPALEKLAKELRASQYHCSNLLVSGEYQLLSVDAPNVPQDELKTAIRWRLKDMLDFHVNDATIDVFDVPVDKEAPTRAHSMYAVAARNQVIELRQALFEEAKIPLKVIDIPEMAQRNIAALLEPPGRGLALLSFDAGGGLLTITFGGELYLSRRLDIGYGELAHADEEQRNALFDRITLELQRSFDHFDRQYRHVTLAKLLLVSLGDLAAGLQTYLASNLYVPVDILALDTVLDISKVPELKRLDSQQRYFLTLGAALRQEEIVP